MGASSFVSSAAGGTLQFDGTNFDLTTSASAVNRTLTIQGAGTTNIVGAINNGGTATAGKVTVTSTGTTTLSGNNTYDGLTTMDAAGGVLTLSGDNSGADGGVTLTAGTLNVNSANALGTGAVSIASSAVLDNTSGAAIINLGNNPVTLGTNTTDALIFGTGASTSINNLDLGTGVVTASSSRLLTLAGTGTTLTMGTLNVTSTATTGRTFTFDGPGNTAVLRGVNIAPSSPNAVTAALKGSADLTITGAIVNGSAFDNGLNLDRDGLTSFSGTNSYTGETKISSGTLKVFGASALSSGSTLTSSTSNLSTSTLNLATADSGYTMNQLSIAGIMRITGPMAGSSTLTFTGGGGIAGTFSGRTIDVGTGTTVVINGAGFDFIGATGPDNRNTNFIVNGALTFNAVVQDNASGDSAGFVGGFTKTGSGVLTLAGPSTYGGSTNVSEGTLLVNNTKSGSGGISVALGATLGGAGTLSGSLNAAGTIAPGNAGVGTLTTASATLTGSLAIEVDGAAADKLVSTGSVDLTGATLTVAPVGAGFTAPPYVIAEGASLTGPFASVPLGYSVSYTSTQAILSLSAASPYTTWANSFGLENPWITVGNPALNGEPTADPDNDGVNNQAEYAFGLTPNSGSSVNPIIVQLNKGTGLFTYTRRLQSLTTLTYAYEYSTTLSGAWIPFTPDSTTPSGISPVEQVIVDVPNALLTNAKLFVRITAQ